MSIADHFKPSPHTERQSHGRVLHEDTSINLELKRVGLRKPSLTGGNNVNQQSPARRAYDSSRSNAEVPTFMAHTRSSIVKHEGQRFNDHEAVRRKSYSYTQSHREAQIQNKTQKLRELEAQRRERVAAQGNRQGDLPSYMRHTASSVHRKDTLPRSFGKSPAAKDKHGLRSPGKSPVIVPDFRRISSPSTQSPGSSPATRQTPPRYSNNSPKSNPSKAKYVTQSPRTPMSSTKPKKSSSLSQSFSTPTGQTQQQSKSTPLDTPSPQKTPSPRKQESVQRDKPPQQPSFTQPGESSKMGAISSPASATKPPVSTSSAQPSKASTAKLPNKDTAPSSSPAAARITSGSNKNNDTKRRSAPLPSSAPETTTVQLRKDKTGVGLALEGQQASSSSNEYEIVVKNVERNKAAAIDGRIKAGDLIHSIDGKSLKGVSPSKAIMMLVNSKEPIITFEVSSGSTRRKSRQSGTGGISPRKTSSTSSTTPSQQLQQQQQKLKESSQSKKQPQTPATQALPAPSQPPPTEQPDLNSPSDILKVVLERKQGQSFGFLVDSFANGTHIVSGIVRKGVSDGKLKKGDGILKIGDVLTTDLTQDMLVEACKTQTRLELLILRTDSNDTKSASSFGTATPTIGTPTATRSRTNSTSSSKSNNPASTSMPKKGILKEKPPAKQPTPAVHTKQQQQQQKLGNKDKQASPNDMIKEVVLVRNAKGSFGFSLV